MSYDYRKQKPVLLTDEGFKVLLGVRDKARELMPKAGVATVGAMLDGQLKYVGACDSWTGLAAIDWLVELGDLIPVSSTGNTQDHVYRAGPTLKDDA